jgi:hypothetical protein
MPATLGIDQAAVTQIAGDLPSDVLIALSVMMLLTMTFIAELQ